MNSAWGNSGVETSWEVIVRVKVKIFVEGGGKGDRADTITDCRLGFAAFIARMLPRKHQPRIIPCGTRSVTYKLFCKEVKNMKRDDRALLLVDSEEAVSCDVDSSWKHFPSLEGDKDWKNPDKSESKNVHLMVQCMESWFIADSGSVAEFYGKNFRQSAFSKLGSGSVEGISRQMVEKALKDATVNTRKGTYHKTRHGFALLHMINPEIVIAASEHAAHLRKVLREWLDDRPE